MFEKKRGKRFLASVMALVMLLSLAPVGALAAKNDAQWDMADTFEIQGDVTHYALSGESHNNFTEARYIWEKDNTVYLAFIISYGQGNDKPILSATASNNELNVGTRLYANLKFGENNEIPATGKKVSRWQIATYEGSIQRLLNTGNTLTISADTGAGGYDLDRVEYTVKDYPIPGEPGGGGGTPGGSDGDGDQQGTADNVKVTYNANLDGADTDYTVPAEISVEKNKEATISKWTKNSAEVDDATVTATKDGKTYAFKGWSTTPSEPAEDSILHALGTLQVTENTTLYAIWEKKEDTTPVDPPPAPLNR